MVVPQNPGNVSAFGLLTVDVKNDYVQTAVCRHDRLEHASVEKTFGELTGRAGEALDAEGFARADHRYVRTADLRYFGQAFEVRVDVPDGVVDADLAGAVATSFHDAHRALYGYDFRDDPRQQVEWVNLRVTGIGPITRPGLTADRQRPGRARRDSAERARTGTRGVCFEPAEGYVDAGIYWRPDLRAGDELSGPVIIEEFGSTVPVHPGFTVRVDAYGNLVITREASEREVSAATTRDPITVEIIQGTLASVEMEVETAIARTSRSPMIRDAHDFRAGIHDRRLRKLTGRSYSALVHPIVRDYPLDTMHEGDVFFHNDVYASEGGIGHLPDLCVTVPVFHEGVVVAFVQAFGHHDDIGGACPGSMPSGATSVFEEGLMVPPIRLWDKGVPNEAALRIMTRNSRMPESLAADLDAECSACLMGAAPSRRPVRALRPRHGGGGVRRDPGQDHRDLPARDPVEDPGRRVRLGGLRRARRRRRAQAAHPANHVDQDQYWRSGWSGGGPKLVIDFTGTGPQAKGPINHCGDYADGNFLKKWLAPILRNLADTPERMAELDVNEGVVPLIEMRFPDKGTLLTPIFPAPTNARTFVILRLLGVLAGVLAKAVDGRMPADQETIRYTGVYGKDRDGNDYLMREVLGGGSGGRYYADGEDTIHVVPDSRNLPTEFTESRFPLLVERLGLAVDSGGPGRYRGGLGYEKHIRMLKDAHFMSIADRSILACWGVKGGKAGRSFQVTIDVGGPNEREVDALADNEPVLAGEVIRIRTTGGGGWGDPLERPYDEVERDLSWGKVSFDGARADYGVVASRRQGARRDRRGSLRRTA